jgi:2-keto-4-pentenoate hydratase/2-oxohepta-3-ene-1,7-dioic acid hydratase in catechol pathway
MQLVSFVDKDGIPMAGVSRNDQVWRLADLGPFPSTLIEFIAAGSEAWNRLRPLVAELVSGGLSLREVELLAPVPRPRKNIICLGWNYAAHARESASRRDALATDAAQLPEHPIVFTKAPTTVTGPHAKVPYDPGLSTEIDWEVELAVIIGKSGRTISQSDALDHVFGYTVLNDLSARDIQRRHKQFFLGKSLDGHCPMGPWIVTADAIPNPQDLRLRTWVNGTIKQDGTTAHQIFSVARTISILSRGMTLEPGDIIATGTPDGVGYARTPPEFLRPGDVVECEIEGIGRIRNQIDAGD